MREKCVQGFRHHSEAEADGPVGENDQPEEQSNSVWELRAPEGDGHHSGCARGAPGP